MTHFGLNPCEKRNPLMEHSFHQPGIARESRSIFPLPKRLLADGFKEVLDTNAMVPRQRPAEGLFLVWWSNQPAREVRNTAENINTSRHGLISSCWRISPCLAVWLWRIYTKLTLIIHFIWHSADFPSGSTKHTRQNRVRCCPPPHHLYGFKSFHGEGWCSKGCFVCKRISSG